MMKYAIRYLCVKNKIKIKVEPKSFFFLVKFRTSCFSEQGQLVVHISVSC